MAAKSVDFYSSSTQSSKTSISCSISAENFDLKDTVKARSTLGVNTHRLKVE